MLIGSVSASPAAAAPPEAGPIATFHYTGGPQLFTVPEGVTYLTFDAIGGRGGYPTEGGAPGPGGETIAGLDVTPGQVLTIWVGENAGGSGGWGYTCGGDQGIATENPRAFDGGGGGGSSAVTAGAWNQGTGSCAAATRPAGEPLIVGGGGGGGGGSERIPLSNYQGGEGGGGGEPAQAGFPGQGGGPGPGGCVNCGAANGGGRGASYTENSDDTMGGGGGGGGGYEVPMYGRGGGGGGRLPSGNGAVFGGGGGAGGVSFAAPGASRAIFVAGPLDASGVVTVSAVHQEGFSCTGFVQHPSVPAGVQYAHLTAEGAAGGTRSGGDVNAPPGKGGHGGIVGADLAGFAWDRLNVYVGCAGSDAGDGGGGYGYGSGGGKGTANADEGEDAAGGGGGSGIEIGEIAVLVAGGGGGGGGGAETFGAAFDGGDGGGGGPPGQSGTWGHDGEKDQGGQGGCPGSEFRGTIAGGAGGGSSTHSGGGGGGGGGGGWGGGCGGEGGNPLNGGGGGGGGGGSYALGHSAAVTNPTFSTSTGVATDGSVVFSYVVSTPSHLTVAGGSGQQAPIGATFAKPLEAQVLDQNGRPLDGIPVTFTVVPPGPGSPSGHFAGGGESATAGSDAKGIAVSPSVAANLQTGAWQIRAEVGGVAPIEFGLTNTTLPTGTSLKGSANPALAGEPVTFTATVKGSSSGPAPSGTVQFTSDGAALGEPVPLAGGTAQKAAELALGSHTIEAVLEPDEGFETSKAKLTEVIEKAISGTEVTSSENPSGFGEAVTFTAHVAHAGAHAAAGTVQFELDGTPLGAPVPVSGGTAISAPISSLAVASHKVVAGYSGNEFVAASTGKLTQSVGPDATGTELAAEANPSVFGQAVTFTATVRARSGDTPTGQISFLVDGTEVCEGMLSGGSAGCRPAAPLAPGEHDVVAEYAGDADFAGSHGTLTETVAKAPTGTSVSADVAAARFGRPVTFSAEVSVPAPGGGIPTGEVRFTLDGEPLGAPVTITGGVATTTPISTLPVGINAVGAEYSGDADHAGSGEILFEEVTPGATITALTSSADPTIFGVPVLFAARVEPTAPAQGEPGGTVRFTLDGSAICDVPLSAGEATCEAPTLYAGDHDVVASYSGEADFEPSDGRLTESVVRVSSHTVASTSAATALAGEPVTLSADVVGGLAGETPAGTVSFRSADQLLGTAQVHPTVAGAGRAELETSSLPIGSHQIVATYSGDEAIESSSAPPFAQTVDAQALALEPPPQAPPACTPRNVRARLLVFGKRNQIRLVARNRAAAPAKVTVRFSDEHGHHSKLLGKLDGEVAGDGMVRVIKRLPAAEMKRLRHAGGGFAVEVAVAAGAGDCAVESSRPLSVGRLVSGQRVWFQRDSIPKELPPNGR